MGSAENCAEQYRGLMIKANKCLYEGVIVPTALYRSEALGSRSSDIRKVNVHEMKYLRCLIGVLRMDRVRIEVMRRRLVQSGSESIGMVWAREENG